MMPAVTTPTSRYARPVESSPAPTGQPAGNRREDPSHHKHQKTGRLWPAPYTTGPVNGLVTVPGSKSATNRALILAALSEGPSRIRRGLRARDTELMAIALRQLGVGIEELDASDAGGEGSDSTAGSEPDWYVTPAELRGPATIDCGLAGTVMRFVPAVAGLATGVVHFDGDGGARVRPMRQILAALRQLGVVINDDGNGTLPFTVIGSGRVVGGSADLDASASSQFVSALLLAGARYEDGVHIKHVGVGAVPSTPHIEMTLDMLGKRGLTTRVGERDWLVEPGPIVGRDDVIEPDLSNAGPYLAAALVTAGRVTVRDWPATSTQPGVALVDLFARMGATAVMTAQGLRIIGPDRLTGLDADLHDVGELTPILTACAALASTPSSLRGIAHLRGHETDRLAALAREINALGGKVTETADGLEIQPSSLHAGVFHTYDDHRMATAGAVLGLRVKGIEVENIATTAKTLPDFARTWETLISTSSAELPDGGL